MYADSMFDLNDLVFWLENFSFNEMESPVDCLSDFNFLNTDWN